MKVSYPINYSGYFTIHRSILLLVKNSDITLPELATYIYLVAQTSFDKRHKHYTAVLRDDRELAQEFGLSPTTIYRHRKKLINKGLLTFEGSITKITNYHMFEPNWAQKLAKLKPAILQEFFAKKMEDFANSENIIANLQAVSPSENGQSFNTSFKGSSLSPQDIEDINDSIDESKGYRGSG